MPKRLGNCENIRRHKNVRQCRLRGAQPENKALSAGRILADTEVSHYGNAHNAKRYIAVVKKRSGVEPFFPTTTQAAIIYFGTLL